MKRFCLSVLYFFVMLTFVYAGPYGPGAPSSGDPPKAAGEYRVLDKDGNTKYIGETNDLKRRTEEHQRSGKIEKDDKVLWKKADPSSTSEERRKHERESIKKYQPYENKSKGGEGRYARSKKEPFTVTGMVSEVKSKKGKVIGATIQADNATYTVVRKGKGYDVAKLVGKKVEVKGTVSEKKGKKYFYVKDYRESM